MKSGELFGADVPAASVVGVAANAKIMPISRWRAAIKAASISMAAMTASVVFAATTTVSVLIDSDNNIGTGCTISTANGPFAGVDRVLNTLVVSDTTGYRITSISMQSCVGISLNAPTVFDASSTPLARGNGVNGTTAVETYMPSLYLPALGQKMRVGITTTGADGLVGTDALTLTSGGPILVDGPPLLVIPTLAKMSLALTALLLALSVWFARRRGWHGLQMVFVAAFALSISGQLIAAIVRDGFIVDWQGVPAAAIDPAGDSPAGTDITNFYSTVENGNVFFRVDTVLNAPPVANAQSVIAVVGQSVPITLTGSDYEASPLTFTVVTPPAQGVLTGAPPNLTYTPNANATSSDSFTFKANDGLLDSAAATVSIDIKRPPTITSANSTVFIPGQANSFSFTATGVPPATFALSACAPALPASIALTNNGNNTATLAGNPTVAQGGTYVCTLTASNGFGTNATQPFTLNVGLPPTFTSAANTTFTVGTAGSFAVTTSAIPATTGITQSGALPSGVTFVYNGPGTPLTATLAGTPAAGTVGVYPITLTAANGIPPATVQNFTLTVGKAPTSTALTSSQNPSVLGQSVTLTATVSSPAAGAPTGNVSFFDGATPLCASVAVAGNTATCGLTTLSVAAHSLTAIYNGDTNFAVSPASPVLTQTVNKASTTTALVSGTNPSVFGQSVTFTATVAVTAPGAGTLSGDVTFLDGATPLCSAVVLVGTAATCTTSALSVASHSITATYNGSGNFNASTSAPALSQTVNKAATSSAVTTSGSPSVSGQTVTFTATVAAALPGVGTPGGTVTFLDGATPLCPAVALAAGSATCALSTLSAASHPITVSYSGDGNFNGSTSAVLTQVVNLASTTSTVVANVNPTLIGGTVVFTANVAVVAPGTGTPAGTVTFKDGAANICTAVALVSASATCSTSALALGPHSITVVYSGNASFATSTSAALTQTVNKADTTVAVTRTTGPEPSVFGQSLTFTGTVSVTAPGTGTPTGTITFFDGATPICTVALVGTTATCSVSTLTVASHSITATYNGDPNFNVSPASPVLTQTVSKASTSVALARTTGTEPAVFGQPLTFTATVSVTAPGAGAPTGDVTFFDGATPVCTAVALTGNTAICSPALSVASHSLTAVYNGDGSFTASAASNTLTQTVNKASTTTSIASGGNPSVFGQSVIFTATVSITAPGAGALSGGVTFLDGATPLCTAVAVTGNTATCTISSLAVGSHTVTATYLGNGNFNASAASAPVTQVVNKANSTTAASTSGSPSVSGQTVTFTATVGATLPGAGTSSGAVTFLDGATPLCTAVALVSSSATCATSLLTVASHTITVSYSGDSNFNGSTSAALTQVVSLASTTTAVIADVNPSLVGGTVTFTANVAPVAPGTGTPGGTVTFKDGASNICTNVALVAAAASCATNALILGTHSITAVYSGSASFAASTSGVLTQTVNQAPVFTSATSAVLPFNANNTFNITTTAFPAVTSITLTACSTPLPTGMVFSYTSGNSATITTSAATYVGPSPTINCTVTATNSVGPTTQALQIIPGSPPVPTPDNFQFRTTGAVDFTADLFADNGNLVDNRGVPLANISSFGGGSLGGAVTTNVAGASVALAGGTLTVAANGTLTFARTPGPVTQGNYSFSYRLSNTAGFGDALVSLLIGTNPVLTGATGNLSLTVGQIYTGITYTATGFPAPTLSATGLPPGLGLASGQITGRPTNTQPATSASVTATNVFTPMSDTFNITVTCDTLTPTPAALGPYALNTAITSTLFGTTSSTGNPSGTYAYTVTAGTLPAGVSLTSGGTLSGTPTVTGSFPITVTTTNSVSGCIGTRAYTIAVNQAVTAVPDSASGTIPTPLANVTVNSPNLLANDTVGFPAGTIFSFGGGSLAGTVTTNAAPASQPLAGGTLTVNPNGTWSLVNPTTAGVYTFLYRLQNSTPTLSDALVTITLSKAPTISSANSTIFTVGQAGTFSVTTSNTFPVAALSRTGVALPSAVGFTDNGNGTGTLAGTPGVGTAGLYSFQFNAANGVLPDAAQAFSLRVCPVITINPLPSVPTRTNAYLAALAAVGGTGPYTYVMTSGSLASTSLSGAGVFSGNVTASGAYNFTVTATDTATNCTGATTFAGTINEPPVAAADSYQAVGNTLFVVHPSADSGSGPHLYFLQGGLLANDNDGNGGGAGNNVVATAGTFATTGSGSITLAVDGTFSYLPAVGFTGVDTYAYTVTDTLGGTATGTVSFTVSAKVWYVKNNFGGASDGRSTAPFVTLLAAQTASVAGDTIFIHGGTLTNTGQSAGITLKTNQRLLGEAYGLPANGTFNAVVNPVLLAANTANRPLIDNTAAGSDGVTILNVSGVEVRGISVSGTQDAIDLTTTAANSGGAIISDNIIRQPGIDGIHVAAGGSGAVTLAISNNTITGNVRGMNLLKTAGTMTITDFSNNVITSATPGSGVVIDGAIFDATTGNPITTVSGGSTVIGASGTPVGAAGMALTNVVGDISFIDLDIYNNAGVGLRVTSTGSLNAGAGTGFRLAVSAGVATIDSNGGPAIDVSNASFNMPTMNFLRSTNSTTSGVSLVNAFGGVGATTLSAPSGQIADPVGASGTAFNVNGGNGNVSFGGAIVNTSGNAVVVTSRTSDTVSLSGAITETGTGISLTNNPGATINFTGTVSATTGANAAFTATGGGTLSSSDVNSTLTTTTGSALNVVNTSIGAAGLKFRSISSNGAANGIVVNNTGTSGALTVSGTGSAGSGGTIQSSTADGIVLTATASPSLAWMNVSDSAGGATDDGIVLTNITGTVTIANSVIANSPHNGVTVDNNNTNMVAFNFTNNTVSCASGQPCQPSGSIGNDGLLLVMRGTSVLTSGVVSGSTFSGHRAVGVQIQANDTARIGVNSGAPSTFVLTAANSFVVQSNTFTGNGQGVDMDTSQVSNMTFQVLSNTINGRVTAPGAISNQSSATAINAFSAAGNDTGPGVHSFVGKIDGNIIGTQGVKDSGAGFGNGIRVVVQGNNTQGVITVNNNTIREVPNAAILNFIGQNGAGVSATQNANSVKFKITNNNAAVAPSGSNLSLCGPVNSPCGDAGIFVLADELSPVCSVITGNNIFDLSAFSFDVYLAERAGPPANAQLTVEGVAASVSAFILANNTLAGVSKFVDEGAPAPTPSTLVAVGACGAFP